jgi:AraC-like DNA-binding protein
VTTVQPVAAATVRALLAGFRAAGLDEARLAADAGLELAALDVPEAELAAERFPALWKAAFRQAPREELPTEVGLGIPFGAFGALDYLAGSSPTVEAAFRSLQAHFRQVADLRLEVETVRGGGDVRLEVPRPFEGRVISDEMTIAILVGRFRGDAAGDFRPAEVRLTRPAPRRPTRHAALLGCPVAFGCSVAGLSVPPGAWSAPMRRADAALQRTLRDLARRLDLGAGGDGLEVAVRARLRALLPEGRADVATLCRTLGMSERTLHRRLRAEGRSYREVLDAFREAEAERWLASGDVPLSEVAARLGFADQSAWNRAFRRWKGMAPSEWRRTRSAPGGPAPRRRSAGRSRARPRRRPRARRP